MADTDFRIPLQTSSPTERVFPALKSDQIERAAAHGRLRRLSAEARQGWRPPSRLSAEAFRTSWLSKRDLLIPR